MGNPLDVPAEEDFVSQLRARIVDGRLQPGARVGQAEIADELGISRGSVREALRRLTGDGLVDFEVNRGFFVADVGLERVLERLEARLLLEPTHSSDL